MSGYRRIIDESTCGCRWYAANYLDKAVERNTGARGLRSIIEDIIKDVMFEIPSNPKIVKCTVTKETVESKAEPELILDENNKREGLKHRENSIIQRMNVNGRC